MKPFINFILLICLCLLQACGPVYDKEYYEKISGVKIPENASELETVDNGEWLTVTSFKLTQEDVRALRKKYSFEAVDGSFVPGFFGNEYLEKEKPGNSDLNKCLMRIQQNGKATAVYVLDTSKQLLWAEINYPDWAGN